ncbi:unnamed protein product [Onchocerca flexuosa]|uniref:Transposase n=1 Tax=Onchocerca flexuosa TaxID=387005 RepID=A0A183I8C3_9BILA|nr:unnamed protein product [Onchocerca flexuosa]
MKSAEKSSELDDAIIGIKNISISDNFIASEIDKSCTNSKLDPNIINTKIDEKNMPAKLRGKQWIIKRAIGEVIRTYSVFGDILYKLGVRCNLQYMN